MDGKSICFSDFVTHFCKGTDGDISGTDGDISGTDGDISALCTNCGTESLSGSYSAIHTGRVRDALVDFTGGLTEAFNLRQEERLPPDLFGIMETSYRAGSIMVCGIWGDIGAMKEEQMWNGLYKGHAYSITCVLQARVQGWSVKLLRLRNPWGRKEWTGAWSDGSDEWKNVSSEDKEKIGLTTEDDGEYWISYEDFLTNFHALDIVHLSAATFARIGSATETLVWEETAHAGRWIKGVSAGGSGLLSDNKDLYYMNPQFYVVLKEADDGDVGGECTCVISLMQHQYRKRKMNPNLRSLVIGLDVHLVKDGKPELLTSDTVCEKTMLKKQFRTRTMLREVSCRLSLNPGVYCIIPNTLKPHMDSDFLLRIYTHSKITSGVLEEKTNTPGATEDNPAKPVGSVPSELFWVYAGDDHGIDARDLRDILNELSRKEFGRTSAFGLEACRSFLAMIDKERSGVLSYEETSELWDELLFWKKIFNRYDRDKSGSMDTYELRKVFKDIGITLGLSAISALATRYGGKDMTMFFEDFALCLARTMSLQAAFKAYSVKDKPGEARLTMDEARVQMTGMANRIDDLAPCPPSPQYDYSVSLTVLPVGRPSNGDSIEHSRTRHAGLTTSPAACKTTILSRSLSCWSSSSKYSSNKVFIWSR
ncbi:Calpain-1 catalytic subunit [Lamellibrachia satsuma]|nr:Calpain-1 catalytic subunit [Lamellibrachia satsuma]